MYLPEGTAFSAGSTGTPSTKYNTPGAGMEEILIERWPVSGWAVGVLLLVWLGSASLAGLVLALVARRVHPGLSTVKLWAFYSGLTAFLVAVVLAVAWL